VAFDDVAVHERGMAGRHRWWDARLFLDWREVVAIHCFDFEPFFLQILNPLLATATSRVLVNRDQRPSEHNLGDEQ